MREYEANPKSGGGQPPEQPVNLLQGDIEKRERAISEEIAKVRNLNELYIGLILLAKQTGDVRINPEQASVKDLVDTGNFFLKEVAKVAILLDSMTPGSNPEHETRMLLLKAELGDFSDKYGIGPRVNEMISELGVDIPA